MTSPDEQPSFRLAYVPGATPGKWARIWAQRSPSVPLVLDQVEAAAAADTVRSGAADAALLRLPGDRDGLHAIPLYEETTVVVVPRDHLVTAADEVSPDDLADEIVQHPLDDVLGWDAPPGRSAIERPATTADAFQLVAAGAGLLVVPQSLARLHHRRDLAYRPLLDVPRSRVALAWPETGEPGELMEQMIGIVRGRTVNSTRGRQETEGAPAKRKPAAKKQPTGRTASPAGRRGKPRRRR